MSLKVRIDAEIKKAMLAKEKDRLTALRGIKSQILLAETEKGVGDELKEDVEMKLLSKAAKQRQESAEIYKKEGRDDLYEKEMKEFKVISEFLPEQLSDEAIENEIKVVIKETGADSMKDMGKVMGIVTKKLSGKADGRKISDIVKRLLS
jgi:hypothetical protein